MIRVLLFFLLFAKIANAQTVGPCIGSLGPTEAFFLYRPGEFEIDLELSVLNQEGEIVSTAEATALKADDFVAKFHPTFFQTLEPLMEARMISNLERTGQE